MHIKISKLVGSSFQIKKRKSIKLYRNFMSQQPLKTVIFGPPRGGILIWVFGLPKKSFKKEWCTVQIDSLCWSINVFCKPESRAGGTWNWTLSNLTSKNQTGRAENVDSICLVSMFLSWFIVLKLPKIMNFFVILWRPQQSCSAFKH